MTMLEFNIISSLSIGCKNDFQVIAGILAYCEKMNFVNYSAEMWPEII